MKFLFPEKRDTMEAMSLNPNHQNNGDVYLFFLDLG